MKRRHFVGLIGLSSVVGGYTYNSTKSYATLNFNILNNELFLTLESNEIDKLNLNLDKFSMEIFDFDTLSEDIVLTIFATHNKTDQKYKIYSQEYNLTQPSDNFNKESLDSSTYDLLQYFDYDDLIPTEGNTKTTLISVTVRIKHTDIPTKEYTRNVELTINNTERSYKIIHDKNLQLHYPLIEFSDIITDESSNSHNGTNNGAENMNNSALFDGDSYISVPKESNKKIDNELSISLWTKKDSTSTLYSELDDTDDYILFRDNSSLPDFRLSSNGTDIGLDFESSISTGEWVHVVATYNLETGLKLYLNGNLDSESDDTIGSLNVGIQPINIGRDPRDRRYTNGKIANVQVYSKELEMDDVKVLASDKPFDIR